MSSPQDEPLDPAAVLDFLSAADIGFASRALAALETALGGQRLARDALQRCRLLIDNRNSEFAAPPAPAPEQLSPMSFAVGTTSADGTSVLGHDGYIYLTEGSNHVLSRYQQNETQLRRFAAQWCDLFDQRATRQLRAGRQYLQFILPEKISALPEKLPFALATPTRLLTLIEDHCSASGWPGRFLSPLALFRASGARCVTRLDSHQSTHGSFVVAHAAAVLYGYDGLRDLRFTENSIRSGDLAFRMFGTPIYEACQEPDFAHDPIVRETAKLVEMHQPPEGNLGTRCVWRNDQAPIRLRAVAFGNSCFERGGSPLLSWWFAHLFAEFHFVWSNIVDDAYAASISADLVIGQTMERFLFVNEVPES